MPEWDSRRGTPGRLSRPASGERVAGRTSAACAAYPFCLRSWNIEVAMSPQSWMPPLTRRPVQTMISVRAGRSSFTSFRVAVARLALRLPFFVFAGSSPATRRISPQASALNRSTT